METKYLIFFFALLFGVMGSAVIIVQSRFMQRLGLFLAVFTIPFVNLMGINFFDDKNYRGTARGYEILSTDLVVITMLVVLIMRYGSASFKLFPLGAPLYIFYFAISFFSIINADSWNYWGYEIMKMTRIYFYFVVLYNCIVRYKTFMPLMYAFSGVILCTCVMMLIQKYAWGMYQPPGVFPHRNSAAMFGNMCTPLFLSMLLNYKLSRLKAIWFWAAFLMGCLVVVMSLSRGAIVMLPLAVVIVTIVSLRRQRSFKKFRVLFVIFALGGAVFLRAAPRIIERFESAPESSKITRIVLANAAVNMADDKFLGVGLNNWGIKINPPYTYWENTGMQRVEGERAGIVETIYLLVAAECGWIGLAALIMWFLYYYLENFLNIGRFGGCPGEYMPVGILASLTALYLQSALEWVLKQPTNFYGLATIFAIVAAMSQAYYQANRANTFTKRISLWIRKKKHIAR